MSPKMGRPPKDNPKAASIHIRATVAEKEAIMQHCKATGKTCLELLKAGIEADKKA